MYAKYKLSNGEILCVYLTENILNNENYSASTVAYALTKEGFRDDTNEIKLYVKKNRNGELFFEYKNEKILFKNFDYMTIDQLIENLSLDESKYRINNDDILATFLKDTDNIGLICELAEYDTFFAFVFGIRMTDQQHGEKIECLCIPTEKEYKKDEWKYKITIEAEDEELRNYCAEETYYFSDFVSHIIRGNIKLVNRNNYKLTNNTLKRERL